MGKEGDLWDDSALINAFDDAISKYKRMHGREQHDSSKEGANTEESLSTLIDESDEVKRHGQADDNSNVKSATTAEPGETNDPPVNKENHVMDSYAQEPNLDSSSGQHALDALQDYSKTQGAGDYSQLLNQYYELEEQRQKILLQLQQFDSSDYQGSSAQWGTFPASQEHPGPTCQSSYPTVVSSCCPYACQCLVAPCAFGGTCAGMTCDATSAMGHNGKSTSFEDGDIIKTAVGAAERALSSLRLNGSGNSNHEYEQGVTYVSMQKLVNVHCGKLHPCAQQHGCRISR